MFLENSIDEYQAAIDRAKRKLVTLDRPREFVIGYDDESNLERVKVELLRGCGMIQMKVGREYFTTGLKPYIDFHKKLGKLIAIAKEEITFTEF